MRASHVLSLLIGAAIAGGVMLATQQRGEEQRAPARAPASQRDPRIEEVLARLERIESQLVDRRAPTDVAASGAVAADIVPAKLARPDSANDGGESETPKRDLYPKLSNDELRIAAKAHQKDLKQAARTLKMWNALLARDLSPEARAEALVERGTVLGKIGELDAGSKSMREAIDTAGIESEQGQNASFRLGWVLHYQGRPAEAIDAAQAVINQPGATKIMRVSSRWAVAIFANESDPPRARRELQTLLAEIADEDGAQFNKIRRGAEQQLEKLR